MDPSTLYGRIRGLEADYAAKWIKTLEAAILASWDQPEYLGEGGGRYCAFCGVSENNMARPARHHPDCIVLAISKDTK